MILVGPSKDLLANLEFEIWIRTRNGLSKAPHTLGKLYPFRPGAQDFCGPIPFGSGEAGVPGCRRCLCFSPWWSLAFQPTHRLPLRETNMFSFSL